MKKTILILGCLFAIGVTSISCNRDEENVIETPQVTAEQLSFFTSNGNELKVVLTKDGSTVDLEETKKLNGGAFPTTGDVALDTMIKDAKQEDLKGRVEVKAITGGKLLFVKKPDNKVSTFRSSKTLLNADAFKGSTAIRTPLDPSKYDLTKAVAPSWVDITKAPTRYHEVENPASYTLFNSTGWFFAPKK